jgi:hypothetical protein
MKQPVRLTIAGEDYEDISTVLLEYIDLLKKEVKTPAAKAKAKRIFRSLARAKKRPVMKATYIQQMRKDKNGEDELCYLGILEADGNYVPIIGAKQRDSSLTAKRDAFAALRRVEANLDREWA